jgi:hypothetical protein
MAKDDFVLYEIIITNQQPYNIMNLNYMDVFSN